MWKRLLKSLTGTTSQRDSKRSAAEIAEIKASLSRNISKTPVVKETEHPQPAEPKVAAAAAKPVEQKVRPVVTFEFYAPTAKSVLVAGTFNKWSVETALKLQRVAEGSWKAAAKLPPGKHEYRYIVDGRWESEQRPLPSVQNPFGTTNALVEIAP